MTTPLGDRRRSVPATAGGSPSRGRRARPTSPSPSASTAPATAAIDTGIGFYDHLLGSLAHHGLFDLAIRGRRRPRRSTSTTRSRTWRSSSAPRSPRRSATGPGSAASARAPCRWTSRSRRPSSTSAAGRTRSSTCRSAASASAGCRSSSSSTRSRRSPGPPGATLHLRGTGRNDHHLAEAAFKALGRALRVACEPDPRRDRRRLDQGRRSGDARPPPAVAVVDYGAGNLVSIEQALTTVGADVRDRPRLARPCAAPTRCRARRRRGGARRWRASTRRGLVEPIRAWLAADRPFLGICLGLQLLFEGSDEDGADDARRPARPDASASRTRRRCRTSAGTRSSGPGAHPLFDGIADGADFYFVHSYAGAPGPRRAATSSWRDDRARRPVRVRRRARADCSASSSTRSGAARDGLRLLANFVALVAGRLMLRRRVIPCLDVADGRVVKGTRFVDLVDEGDPPELAERYAREGADELVFLDITAAPERRGTLLDVVERTARRAFIPLDRRRRRADASTRCATSCGPAPTRSRSTRRPSPTRRSSPRCAARFGRQAVVVAIDARRSPAGPTCRPAGRSSSRAAASRPGLDAVAWARARRRARRRRAARHLDRPRRHGVRLRHGPAAGHHRPVSACRSSPRAARPARPTSWPRSATAAPTPCSPRRIFHRRIHAIADVKAAMAAAGLPVRLVPEAVA